MPLPFVLPLLGSIGLPALATSGALAGTALGSALAGASPALLAGVGSGVGTLAAGGSLEEGIASGLTAGIGGQLMGQAAGALGMGGGAAGAAGAATPTAAVTTPAQAAMAGIPKTGAGLSMANNLASSGLSATPDIAAQAIQAPGSFSPLAPGISDALPSVGSGQAFGSMAGQVGAEGIAPLSGMGGELTNVTAAPSFTDAFISEATKPSTLLGAGARALLDPASLGLEPEMEDNTVDYMNRDEPDAPAPITRTPDAGYRPGIDPEFDYGVAPNYGTSSVFGMYGGGLADLARYQEGGEARAPEKNDKDIINDAVDAIKGDSPDPEGDLADFIERFGEDNLDDLVNRVMTGQFDMNANVDEGMLRGAGDGMDDLIPATIEGDQDVVLSDGEFIVPADVVSGIGNGSSDAGAKELYKMMDRVREMRTGEKEQPKAFNFGGMLPA